MREHYDEHDVEESIRKGLWAGMALTVLALVAVLTVQFDIPADYPGASQLAYAHAAQQRMVTGEASSGHRDAPVATGPR